MKPKQQNFIKFLTLCLGPVAFGISLQSARAQSATWDGGAATNVLNTAANWTGDLAPVLSGNTATWNGTVADPLNLTWTGTFSAGFGSLGTSIDITAGQTSSLLIGSSSTATSTNADNFNMGNITIANGAGAFTFGDGIGYDDLIVRSVTTPPESIFNTFTNNSSNTATFASNVYFNSGNGDARTLKFEGSGNWLFNSALRFSNGSPMTVAMNGGGTLTLAGPALATGGTNAFIINAGTLKVAGSGLMGAGTLTGNITNNGAFSYESSASQTITGVISGAGTFGQTAGTLILSGINTYNSATAITGGTLNVSGTGSIESSSGITVNGPTARYLHTSTTASTRNISLVQGNVGGTGSLGAVTVANGTGIISNGNGGSAPLTIGTLAFNGAAAFNVADDGDTATNGIVVSGTLSTTPANGTITVNASSPFWNSGVTYNLVSAGTFSASLSDFTLGTITGITGRQAPSLVSTGTGIGLMISGDNPKWSGLDNNNWVVGSTGSNGNWKLTSLGTMTDYIQGDVVRFDDSATNTTVTISAANVSPAVMNFENNSKNYTINGTFGVAAGILNKNGSGTVTLASANTYNGGTNVNAGTLALSGAGTLGATSGALTVGNATVSLGGTSQTVGTLAIGDGAAIQGGTINANGLTASTPAGYALISASLNLGSGNLLKTGDGTLSVSGPTAYTGTTTISGGYLTLSDSGSLGSSSGVTLGGGGLDLGGSTQATNAVTISAASVTGETITGGSITPASFNITSATGVAYVSANILGSTGVTRSGGGTLSLSGENTFTGPLNFAGNGTVTIDGGSNSGGGPITFNSFGSTLTINNGSYLTSGITSNGESLYRFLNLNGGTLESSGNIFADNLAISIIFNGGTLKCGNPAGITVVEGDNWVTVDSGGATIDTTVGNITVGNNTNPLATHLPKFYGSSGGSITLRGGKSLVSGVTSNGLLDIQDLSTLDINGIDSSVNGLSGNGTVTNSLATAALYVTADSFFDFSGTITGSVSLVKQGAETLALSGTLANLRNTSVNAGTLQVNNSSTTFSDASVVSIASGAVLNLTNAATDAVGSLVINGNTLLPGTYGASSPETSGYITGDGLLQVVPPSGYTVWISQYSTLSEAQKLTSADPDADGIPNLVEYAIAGQDPTVSNPNIGSYVGNVLSYAKRSGVTGITYALMQSTDLGVTNAWTEVSGGSYMNDTTTISYTLTPGSPVRNFVRLKILQN